jgi:hypothetical protein
MIAMVVAVAPTELARLADNLHRQLEHYRAGVVKTDAVKEAFNQIFECMKRAIEKRDIGTLLKTAAILHRVSRTSRHNDTLTKLESHIQSKFDELCKAASK